MSSCAVPKTSHSTCLEWKLAAKDAHHTNPGTCSRGFLGFFCKSQIFRMEGLGLSRKQLISSLNKAYLPSAVDCEGWCDFHCTAMALGRDEKTRGRQRT